MSGKERVGRILHQSRNNICGGSSGPIAQSQLGAI